MATYSIFILYFGILFIWVFGVFVFFISFQRILFFVALFVLCTDLQPISFCGFLSAFFLLEGLSGGIHQSDQARSALLAFFFLFFYFFLLSFSKTLKQSQLKSSFREHFQQIFSSFRLFSGVFGGFLGLLHSWVGVLVLGIIVQNQESWYLRGSFLLFLILICYFFLLYFFLLLLLSLKWVLLETGLWPSGSCSLHTILIRYINSYGICLYVMATFFWQQFILGFL